MRSITESVRRRASSRGTAPGPTKTPSCGTSTARTSTGPSSARCPRTSPRGRRGHHLGAAEGRDRCGVLYGGGGGGGDDDDDDGGGDGGDGGCGVSGEEAEEEVEEEVEEDGGEEEGQGEKGKGRQKREPRRAGKG